VLRDAPSLQRTARGETKGTLNVAMPIDGVKRISSFRVLERLPPVVIVAKAEHEVLHGFEAMRRNYYAVAAALTLVLLLLGFLPRRRRGAPITQRKTLSACLEFIAAGDVRMECGRR